MESSEQSRLRFSFVSEGVSAIAELDRERAPRTAAGIVAALPFEGIAGHAIYSGSEVAFFIKDSSFALTSFFAELITVAFSRFPAIAGFNNAASKSFKCCFRAVTCPLS